ncbi:MAG: late competence development ComFB family protein [Spirochaetes bacterium]|jgi:competence protein ComFB|nr:late competence development ComFB family protein [Spirochaetota bacterium]
MNIINIMEEIVSSLVSEVLKKENRIDETKEYFEDICAYVLNRLPAKYVTSERGVLHGLLDAKFAFQQKSDIIMIIYEAMSIIKERRGGNQVHIHLQKGTPNFFLPHLLGEVVEKTTFSKIPGVSITLLYNGMPAQMVSDGWANPFSTNKGTGSYYHFWPKLEENSDFSQQHSFTLFFEHQKCKPVEQRIQLQPVSLTIGKLETKIVPLVLMEMKDGEDGSFLYADD